MQPADPMIGDVVFCGACVFFPSWVGLRKVKYQYGNCCVSLRWNWGDSMRPGIFPIWSVRRTGESQSANCRATVDCEFEVYRCVRDFLDGLSEWQKADRTVPVYFSPDDDVVGKVNHRMQTIVKMFSVKLRCFVVFINFFSRWEWRR